jgi:phosphoribosyl 1,2-cyclic phosphodiesterase
VFIASLGSGSAGNSCLVESDGTSILVDAGFGVRETKKRLEMLGRSIEAIDAIVISHEHGDHMHGAERIAKKYGTPIYATLGTIENSRLRRKGLPTKIFRNNSRFRIGSLEVQARRVIHDAADPSCFAVESGDGARVGIVSDLGCVDDLIVGHLRDCDALLFEANHDLDMLRTGSYPWNLKRRIMSRHGHLSNDDSIAALRRIIGPATKSLCLIHLSEKNNHESIVRSMATALVEELGAPIEVQIARQSQPMNPVEVSRQKAGQMRLW